MHGGDKESGIIPQAMLNIFDNKGNKQMSISYLEIKERDKAFDLLENASTKLFAKNGIQHYKPPLKEELITSRDSIVAVI